MTDKLELKSSHEVVYTVDVTDVNSIFYCKPTDPDILTVLMKDGKRLYCDEVCPVDSMQEEPVRGDFEMALAEMIDNAQKRVVEPWVVAAQWKDELIKLAKSEEPISEELEEAASRYAKEEYNRKNPATLPNRCIGCYAPLMYAFEAGAKWKEKHLTKDATEVTVHIDAGGYPYTPEIELYDYDKDVPLAKEGDKYKVVLIKED